MKKNARDNLAKFFYDGGKVSVTILVIGHVARHSLSWFSFMAGIFVTLLFLTFGVIIDYVPVKGE